MEWSREQKDYKPSPAFSQVTWRVESCGFILTVTSPVDGDANYSWGVCSNYRIGPVNRLSVHGDAPSPGNAQARAEKVAELLAEVVEVVG